jgi:transcriptional regulator with XRE-family HTH domain
MTEQHPSTSQAVQSMILHRLACVRHADIARRLDVSESTVSRIASSGTGVTIEVLGAFLDVLGLELVDRAGGAVTVPKAELEALRTLAAKGIGHV